MAAFLHGVIARSHYACSVSLWRQSSSVLSVGVTHIKKVTVTPQPTTASVPMVRGYATLFGGKVTANELWGGVYGVSNAGRKKGRARRNKKRIDLNRGQIIGVGKTNMVWPGLNTQAVKGQKSVINIAELPADPERETKLMEARDKGVQFRRFKRPPLQRGWTGAKMAGTSIGPPDPVGSYVFEGFDTRVLEFKVVVNMTGNLGRKMRYSSFVVTGNKNGMAGYALAKAPNAQASLRKAKNMAAKRLRFIERFQEHTVFHNFHTKEQQTAIFVYKAAKGKGLTCHRAIKTICEVIGIEDLGAKVEGSTSNIQNMTKAFFAGLQRQETHQELADRVKLNVVEMRPEMENVPIVVARPQEGKTREEGIKEEAFNFENLYYHGKVPLYKPKPEPFYFKFNSWRIKKRFLDKMRNQKEARMARILHGLEPSKEELRLRSRPLV